VCGHQAMNVIADSVQGTTIHNNIIQSASFDCVLGSASGVVSNHNNWCGSGKKFYIGGHWPPYSLEQWRDMTGQDLNSMIADPLFVDPSTDDFHLTESSPCIDAGTEVGLAFEGEAPDLGALEYSTGGDDPPPSDPPPEDPPPPPEEPPNQEPTISALVTSPPADLLTITALGVQDPDGTVTEVRFYRDANGDGVLQVEMDIFLGNGTSHSPEWDVQTNTTDWSSGTHTLFARAYDDDSAYCEASTQVTIGMGEAGEIEGPNGVVVYIFDCDEIKDVDPADIRVKFGKGTVVSTIQLSGTQPMSALGILVSGASQVGTVKDGRSGAKADVAFIASDSPIKTISMKSGMVGADLESYAEGLVELHPDFPGGITAIYSEGSLGTLKVEGDIEGNIWVGGADSKGRAVNSFILKNGHYHGDMVAKGDVNKVCVAGDFGSSIQVGGTVDVGGALAKLEVKPSKRVGGNITAGAHVRAGGLLKKVNICGSLQGGSAEENLVQVLAPSIGTVTITGDVQNSRMLAGADLGNDWRLGGTGSDADCFSAGRIDKIRVKGRVTDSLIGSGLPCAPDNRFDLTWLTENHAFIGGSRIGGLQINRDLTSTATDGTPYGVGSYEIGDAKVGSTKVHPLVVSEI
ncbi:MAG: bactofilin family protein, partial [Planctomycetota bacterium]